MQSKNSSLPWILLAVVVILMGVYVMSPSTSHRSIANSDTSPDSTARKQAAVRNLMSRTQSQSTYQFFNEREINPTATVMRTPCFHAPTDAEARKVIALVERLVTLPSIFHPHNSHPIVAKDGLNAAAALNASELAAFKHHDQFEPDELADASILENALEMTHEAIADHINCPRLHVLSAAILMRIGQDDDALRVAEGAAARFPHHAEILLTAGLIYEIKGRPDDARASYLRAIQAQPRYAREFFGVPIDRAHDPKVNPLLILRMINMDQDASKQVQAGIHVWAIRRLFLAFLIAEDYGTGPVLQREEARAWHKQWYFHVKGMLSPYTVYIARKAYRALVASKTLAFNDGQAIRFTSYNDPTARFLLATHVRVASRITDMPLIPTYSYLGAYLGSEKSELAPHTDRPQCEFTSSTSIDVSPVSAECPLGLNPKPVGIDNINLGGDAKEMGPEDRQVYVYPKPGDSLLFKGRHLVHWRKPIPFGVNCSNLFLHYVHADFPGSLN